MDSATGAAIEVVIAAPEDAAPAHNGQRTHPPSHAFGHVPAMGEYKVLRISAASGEEAAGPASTAAPLTIFYGGWVFVFEDRVHDGAAHHLLRRAGVRVRGPPSGRGGGGEEPAGEVCAVCLAEYEGGEEVRVLPACRHGFHRECVDRWLLTGALTCPVCRATVAARPEEHDAKSCARAGDAALPAVGKESVMVFSSAEAQPCCQEHGIPCRRKERTTSIRSMRCYARSKCFS